MRRIHPVLTPIRTFNGNHVKGESIFFGHAGVVEIELSLDSHVIGLLPDGISGICECNEGHRTYTLHSIAPNTVIFHPANKYMRIRITKAQNQWRLLLLTIEPTILQQVGEDDLERLSELCTEIAVDDPATGQAMLAILQEIDKPREHSSLCVECLLTLTLLRRLNYQLKHSWPPSPNGCVRGGLADWRLKRALQVIEKNSDHMPALSEIAKAVHLTQTSFCRAFKQSTGLSPHHYLLVHRVNRAKEMIMKDPDRRLTDIAFACGFRDSSQFSVVFKRVVGRSPQRYRHSL